MRVRFCNIKKGQYQAKTLELLQSDQFKPMINTDDSVVLKIKKVIKKELMNLKKKNNDISEQLYPKLRSLGSQPARLNGIAKIRKKKNHCALFDLCREDNTRS